MLHRLKTSMPLFRSASLQMENEHEAGGGGGEGWMLMSPFFLRLSPASLSPFYSTLPLMLS